MRITLLSCGFALAATTFARPASSVASPGGTPASLGILPRASNMSVKERASMICNARDTDQLGPDTGMSKKEIWEKTGMNSFLSILDSFLPGNKPPYGEYKGTLPKVIGDLIGRPDSFDCNALDCDKLEPIDCEGNNGLNSEWYMLAWSLRHFQAFTKNLRNNITEEGNELADSVSLIMDRLKPVKLTTSNAGWSIILSAIFGAITAPVVTIPIAVATTTFLGSVFGFATGGMTNTGNNNDEKILNHFIDNDRTVAGISRAFSKITNSIKDLAKKVLEEIPPNTKEDRYSHYKWSAVHLLRDGAFADDIDSTITDKIGAQMRNSMTTGIFAAHMGELIIGSRTKDLFGKKPCDLSGYWDDEFRKVCIGDTAYFIVGWPGKISYFRNPFSKIEVWEAFAEDKNKEDFNGVTPETLVKDAIQSQKDWGWNKQWKPSEDLIQSLIDQVDSESFKKVTMFNYPVLNLDEADDDLGRSYWLKPPSGDFKGTQRFWTINDKLRFIFAQASRQKDEHGNNFPYPMWNDEYKRYPHDEVKWVLPSK